MSEFISSPLCAGQWVEVRTREEILATLDERGCLDELPFMPEMFQYCGRRCRVFKRAHKTCDTIYQTGGRRMSHAVHLEGLRCDGAAHGGCEVGCLIFWKDAWLRRVESPESASPSRCLQTNPPASGRPGGGCTEEDVWKHTRRPCVDPKDPDPAFICQATQLLAATQPLKWWDARQYVEDWRSGNISIRSLIASFTFSAMQMLINAGIGLGKPLRWLYETTRGTPYPKRSGPIPKGNPTPTLSLGLKPGEWVRVRPYNEILQTLDVTNRNRGLHFDAEEVVYCGGTYRVLRQVTKLIDERTGRLTQMKTPSVILEDVYCRACYSDKRLFCPRSVYPMWREIWLERVEAAAETQTGNTPGTLEAARGDS